MNDDNKSGKNKKKIQSFLDFSKRHMGHTQAL